MVYRYIPILRWKRGEQAACRILTPAGRVDVSPLFIVGANRYVGKTATARHVALPPAALLASQMLASWGVTPFFLDCSLVLSPATSPHHPLVDVADECRSLGLQMIPATQLSASSDYESAVATVSSVDGRGVALRIDLEQLASIGTWASAWPHPPSATDLIIDFGDNIENVGALGSAIDPLFLNLPASGSWRSVTISGSSMPENFAGFTAGLHTLPRREWGLWQRLSTITGLPYRLNYADYATVPLVPPPSGIRWGFPINVKYTLPNAFLICRGVRTVGPTAIDPDRQLVSHANSIYSYPARNRVGSCAADDLIDAIAALSAPPKNLEHWVQISINRHIELVRRLLP